MLLLAFVACTVCAPGSTKGLPPVREAIVDLDCTIGEAGALEACAALSADVTLTTGGSMALGAGDLVATFETDVIPAADQAAQVLVRLTGVGEAARFEDGSVPQLSLYVRQSRWEAQEEDFVQDCNASWECPNFTAQAVRNEDGGGTVQDMGTATGGPLSITAAGMAVGQTVTLHAAPTLVFIDEPGSKELCDDGYVHYL